MILDNLKTHLQEIRIQEAIARQAASAIEHCKRIIEALTPALEETEKAALAEYEKALSVLK